MNKLTSRKFWVSVAAFLASIGGSITGMMTNNETVATVGIVCTVLSAAIYAASEAYVDGARVSSTITNITASSTSKEVVEKVLTDATTK